MILAFALSQGGGTTEENAGGTDAGTQGGNDACEQVNTNGLTINVPLGISLTDVPSIGGHAVAGDIEVKRNGETITSATVTINGYALTGFEGADGYPVADDGAIPDAAPGKVLKIVATDGSDTFKMDLPRPTDLTFTWPAEGTVVVGGQQVEFTWSGKVGPYASEVFGPNLSLMANEAGDHPYSLGFPTDGVNYASLEPNDTSATLTLPEIDKPAYLVKLYVPGDEVKSGTDDFGFCRLVRTLHLT